MLRIDKKDYRILYALEKDGRAGLGELAKAAGISKQLASYKLHRLEKEGIIQGYHAIIDTSRLGYITYRAYLKLRHTPFKERAEVMRKLCSIPEVTIGVTLDGIWDGGIAITVKKAQEFHRVWREVMRYREHIKEYEVSIYSPIYHFTRTFLNPEPDTPIIRVLGGDTRAEHDELDKEILRLLSPSIRTPLIRLAQRLGKSVQTVINRIHAMERNGIIQGYRPRLNWQALGYQYFKANVTLRSHARKKEMDAFVRQMKYIFQIDETIGGHDLEIEFYANDLEHFKRIMDEFQERFKEDIESYDYFTVEKTLKEEYLPPEEETANKVRA